MKESEFGKGFVYNLILFAHHFDNKVARHIRNIAFVMKKPITERRLILLESPSSQHNYGFNLYVKRWLENIVPIYGTEKKALSNEIIMWASGATDHLYELEIPSAFKKTKMGQIASSIQETGLEMGHGFAGKRKIYTYDDYLKLWEQVKELGLLIDKKLGLKPIKGQWE